MFTVFPLQLDITALIPAQNKCSDRKAWAGGCERTQLYITAIKSFLVNAAIAVMFVLLSYSSPNAAKITVSKFLATANNDPVVIHQKKKIDFLKHSSGNTPFVNRIELRTETDEFEGSNQKYSLRIYPNAWGEAKAGQKVQDTNLALLQAGHDLLVHQALKKRYMLVIDLVHNRTLLKISQELLSLYEDRVKVLQGYINSLDFDLNDLIEAEAQTMSMQLQLIELENTIKSKEAAIRLGIPGEDFTELDTDNLAGIGLIRQTIQQLEPLADRDNVYIRNSMLAEELAGSRYDLEQSENRRFFSFLEASYDNEERNDPDKAFFLELGIKLPFINADRIDLNRRRLDYLTEKANSQELRRALSEQLKMLEGDCRRLLQQHEFIIKKKQDADFSSSLKMYTEIEGIDPLILLKIRERILQSDSVLENTSYELYQKFVELLDVTGKLSEKPLKNYLASNQEEL